MKLSKNAVKAGKLVVDEYISSNEFTDLGMSIEEFLADRFFQDDRLLALAPTSMKAFAKFMDDVEAEAKKQFKER